ncbi:MAG: aspartate--tRNA ligase [Candidatus Fonsibacter ubiquis]|nr:aspartate--tRNA ligase [Candidatus Fonsibacter ubiquis]NDB38433.1 aspartate--tRNA ligase [Pseudomonadota bacterium]GBL33723.1 aspartate--tRNA(Asp/Asn) ligase [Pelagibacterales bacterium]NCU55903.1 aspartate--tRNA ligase [Candidatus Fonsibacter ubiquis]NDB48290.1 aspartate--tRNA ligase [Pseudomonadota bacterium]
MNKYRTHNCAELTINNIGKQIILSGWIHKKRDHGNLLFIDLRDHYGMTQCVIDNKNEYFSALEKIKLETVIRIEGEVIARTPETINKELATGSIEVSIKNFYVLGSTKELPLPVFSDQEYSEEIRLKYRYLDLRRKKLHQNIILRSNVISFIRKKMESLGFLEYQTPILTSSSPEGARDFLVPSRLNPGKFYALPQAPQQFKQLIMVSGFDRYFQIAPCFRDEDARADRSPGEFYQLDIEMSFVEQEDVFQVVEPLLHEVFTKFSKGYSISKTPFKRFKYKDAMLKFGTDKPDLRNPIEISDVTEIFEREDVKLEIFKKLIQKKSVVRCVVAKNVSSKPRSFFDNLDKGSKAEGASGLGYIILENNNGKLEGKGPIAKFFSNDAINTLCKKVNAVGGDAIFFICDIKKNAEKFSAWARTEIAKNLELIKENVFEFCWVTDYPMFEYNEIDKKIDFSHNPFSMPQTPMDLIDKTDPLELLAYQYDIVCNGIELSSGAIRNHIPELMYKLFKIAGYSKEEVDNKFSGMINALSYGAPPHGGIAPGIDRIIMLLAGEKNIREVTMFPLNQNAQDLMMNAPSDVSEKQLKELNIKLVKKD